VSDAGNLMRNNIARLQAPAFVATLSALLCAACASPPKLYVDRADGEIRCRSFAWLEVPERPASIAEQRVRAEVLKTLEAKGYPTAVEEADCWVSGLIFSGSRPGSPVRLGVGAGSYGGNFGTSIGVNVPVGGGRREVGNLAIDIVDIKQNAEVWRGTLEGAFRSPEPTSDQIGDAVRQILEAFPDPPPGT
jgi:hypothetical protein